MPLLGEVNAVKEERKTASHLFEPLFRSVLDGVSEPYSGGTRHARFIYSTYSPRQTMSMEVHLDWQGQTHFVGRLHAAERGSSVSFEYATEWLQRDGAFAIDPTSLPLQRGAFHAATLFGAIQDCGPDRWGCVLIERAVRKKVLVQKPYQEIDYMTALDDASRIGALRFAVKSDELLTQCGSKRDGGQA